VPYFAFMLMGALAAIPPETQEAARIDGASERQVFFDVTLPQIAPVLGVAVVLKSVFALKVFDMIVTMTGGGPGVSTTTLGFYAYHLGFRSYDFGMASAVAYMLTAILFLLSLSYMRFMFRKRPA
jgi:multiple sugar transport system permease protein